MTTKKTEETHDEALLEEVGSLAKTRSARVYELGYHIMPSIGEDELPKEVTKIKDILAQSDANIVSEEYPKLLTLAYPMTKVVDNKHTEVTSAYFGWVKFEVMPDVVASIEKALKDNKTILRFLFIETVRESTMSVDQKSVRPPREEKPDTPEESTQTESKSESKAKETPSQADDKEIDKTIDELVIE